MKERYQKLSPIRKKNMVQVHEGAKKHFFFRKESLYEKKQVPRKGECVFFREENILKCAEEGRNINTQTKRR